LRTKPFGAFEAFLNTISVWENFGCRNSGGLSTIGNIAIVADQVVDDLMPWNFDTRLIWVTVK